VRIALISTPFVAVPPPSYGGTELIVFHLARALAERGHQVILYATGDSRVPGVTIRAPRAAAAWPPDPWLELDQAGYAVRDLLGRAPVDIIHAHMAPVLAFAPLLDVPVVYTIHHVRDEELQRYYESNGHRNVRFVAISDRQRDLMAPEVEATVVHHGLETDSYPLGDGGRAAAFLGRFAIEKGPATALEVAHAAGVPLRLAGKPHWKDEAYHRAEVSPRLARPGVVWQGEADHQAKCALLGGSLATLFPIDWEEPFGLVMIESMLCGTPVLAFARGAAPELVEDGVTGWLCRDEADMAARLRALHSGALPFDRSACRARAADRFCVTRMAERYLEVYAEALGRPSFAPVPAEAV
jgi:glycosyltransferase involved in cell wall biosynthesis